jgi:hypothetical protein
MAKKKDNTVLYLGGAALLAFLFLKKKPQPTTPTPINIIPTNNNNSSSSGSGGDTGIVAPAPLPFDFTPPSNNGPINPNIPHYNSPNYSINTGGGENYQTTGGGSGGGGGDLNPYKNADDSNNNAFQVQNFLAGLKQALQD